MSGFSSACGRIPASRRTHDPPAARGRAWLGLASAMVLAVLRRLLPLWMAIALALVAVFALEVAFPVSPMTKTGFVSNESLLAFGAVDRHLVVGQGQWWRVVAAGLLHLSLQHLLSNVACLVVVGWLSERLMGPAWFGAVFALSSLSGSAAAVATGPPDMLVVGASGGTTGLFAAALVISFHLPAGLARHRLQATMLVGLALALVPSPWPSSDFAVRYDAHAAGTACGSAAGLAMLLSWPKALPHPRFASTAGAVATSCFALAGAAFVPGLASYRDASLRQEFFDPFPWDLDEALARAPAMIAAKPHDPRARYARALALERAGDFRAAAAELSRALAEKDLLAYLDPPHYEDRMRVDLGYALLKQGRDADARSAAAPACQAEPAGRLHDRLIGLKLCP